jgi:WD40 repeat protein
VKILSYLDQIKDITNYKRINKYFCSLVKETKVLENFFFSKYCISPKSFFALPCDYLLSIKNKLQLQTTTTTTTTTTTNHENSYTNKHGINLKKQLFFAIEKNLSQAKEIALKSIATIRHHNILRCVTFSKDNNFFATASDAHTAKIYQFTNGSWQQLYEINHGHQIRCITFSPDCRYIITSSYLKHIIWEISITNYKQVATHKNSLGAYIRFRDDSKRLFLKSAFGPIKILDLIDNQWKCIFSVKESELHKFFNAYQGSFIDNPDLPVEIKNDNKWLSCIINRYVVCLMLYGGVDDDYGNKDLATKLKNTLNVISGKEISDCDHVDLSACDYSNDMQLIYACSSKSKSSVILEYVNNQWQPKIRLHCSYEEPFCSCFSSDNQRLITRYCHIVKQIDETIVWNINGDEAREELVLDDAHLAKFSQNGRYIITAHRDNQVKIWHFIDGEWKTKVAVKHEHDINDIFFSNYNWMIAVSSGNSLDVLEVLNDCEK